MAEKEKIQIESPVLIWIIIKWLARKKIRVYVIGKI